MCIVCGFFSLSHFEKKQAICFEEINASCEQHQTEKEGVGEQHRLHHCLRRGETGLEVNVAHFQTRVWQQRSTYIYTQVVVFLRHQFLREIRQ